MRTKHPDPELTEESIQAFLFKDLASKGHKYIAPNSCALPYESDLLSITTAGYLIEYEIKISRSDFKADTKTRTKKRKHDWYTHPEQYPYSNPADCVPCRFYYVVPKGLVSVDEVPDHAGLMEISFYHFPRNPEYTPKPIIDTVKQAPQLHDIKATRAIKTKIATTLMWKVFSGVTKEC